MEEQAWRCSKRFQTNTFVLFSILLFSPIFYVKFVSSSTLKVWDRDLRQMQHRGLGCSLIWAKRSRWKRWNNHLCDVTINKVITSLYLWIFCDLWFPCHKNHHYNDHQQCWSSMKIIQDVTGLVWIRNVHCLRWVHRGHNWTRERGEPNIIICPN